MSEYLIKFPIGDWSNDGHGKCDWYMFKSNVPVEELRIAHFKVHDEIMELDQCENIENYDSSRDIAIAWAELIVKGTPLIELEILPEEEIPSITFYGDGFKTIKKIIGFVGYEWFDY